MINDLQKFKIAPFWLVIFLVFPFKKIPLFSKDLFNFIISFIWLFVRAIPQPVIDEIRFLILLPIILSPVSTKRLLSISLGSLFFNFFPNKFFLEFGDDITFLIGESNILSSSNRNPHNCTI